MGTKEFEKRFHEEIVELLVLIKANVGGAAVCGDMLKPSVEFIASVDGKSGELSYEKGRLEWMIPKTPGRTGWGFDFRQYGIYRIKARKSIPVTLEPYMSRTVNNCYMVVDIVEKDVPEPGLEEIREQVSKPVTIEEEGIGSFELDREFSSFQGVIEWMGEDCSVFLETDEEDGDSAESAFDSLKKLYQDMKHWDESFRRYAASELTGLANDWLSEDEASDSAPITEETFAERITISELSIGPDGTITVYYNDDDMFWGHIIEIDAHISGEMRRANIAG